MIKSDLVNLSSADDKIYGNKNVIEAKNLKKIYRNKKNIEDVKAIDNITFSIKKGEIFGLLGPNGAGKTTIINILCGLILPTTGEACVAGYDIKKEIRKIKELIGVCPQQAAIYKYLNAKENIALFGNLHLVEKDEINKRMNVFLDLFGLSEASKRKAKHYSGGMIRQLNLMMALIHDPPILFLDEPTIGMDPRVRRKTWNFINSLKQKNKSIILTTHYIEEAESLCDTVAILDYGQLIEMGPPKDLIEKYSSEDLEEVFLNITGRRILEGF